MLQAIGYFLSLLMGFSLGLVGGGGSILTIPVLVFFFNIDPVIATTYSLFIVGLVALAGSINHYRLHNIEPKIVFLFGIPSVIVLFIVRRWLVALIPATIVVFNQVAISKSILILIAFAIIMFVSGLSMINKKKNLSSDGSQNTGRLILEGCMAGAITGFIGIGGGFIIVPALVLFAGLPMKKAIGTSLTIIIINCLVGLLSNLTVVRSLNYFFLLAFAGFAIAGILAGTWAIRFISDKKLKPVFGWIILGMSVFVLIRIFIQP